MITTKTTRMDGLVPSSGPQHTILAPIGDTYEVDEYRVGKLELFPVPKQLRTKFGEVQIQLLHHLAQATTKVIGNNLIDIHLCMAAECNSSQQSRPTILLEATVWVECGGQKLTNFVTREIYGSKLLQNFIIRESLNKPHVSSNGPYLLALGAASMGRTGEPRTGSLAIQDGVSSYDTICGARAKFSMTTPNSTINCYSTIGGLVIVGDGLFAMTTAHAIVNATADAQLTISEPPGEQHTFKWEETPFPTTYAYVSEAFADGICISGVAQYAADFALIDPASLAKLSNNYRAEDTQYLQRVTDYIPTSELSAGDVWVVTSRDKHARKGYMVDGDASIIMRGAFMHTKIVKVTVEIGMFKQLMR